MVHCDGDGAPSAPVGSPDQQPAAPAAPDSPTAPGAPAAPDAPPPASATPDSPATTKSTGRPKPSRTETRTAHPPRSPPRARIVLIFTLTVNYLGVTYCDEDAAAKPTESAQAPASVPTKSESCTPSKGKPRRDWMKVYGLKKAKKE
uniref:Secreted protein n=1 Tax=Schistosoma mansoni TaxID=6183 RepID=A0A5K4F8N5_SCHMA